MGGRGGRERFNLFPHHSPIVNVHGISGSEYTVFIKTKQKSQKAVQSCQVQVVLAQLRDKCSFLGIAVEKEEIFHILL